MKKKRVLVSVLNDLYTDPRVDKVCRFLFRNGFEVTLIGCRHKSSPKLETRDYQTKRIRLFFKKGPLFFLEYNLKLFFYLLFRSCDVLVANDLDALLPNFLVGKMRHKKIVYDSHEYYCNMVTVIHKPMKKRVWKRIEKFCFPRLEYVTTVSESIAREYQKEYGVDVKVVRNIPSKEKAPITETRQSLQLPENKKIIIMQGNHISYDRGAEELVEAIPFTENTVLLFVGKGEVLEKIKQRASELGIADRVIFVDRVLPEKLFNYTYWSDIGISLDKNASLDHYYSLPNKIFEYIQAETPLIVSDLPERAAIINQYQVGLVIRNLEPLTIAQAINEMINNTERYRQMKENCTIAAEELCWENEEKVLEGIYLGNVEKHRSIE